VTEDEILIARIERAIAIARPPLPEVLPSALPHQDLRRQSSGPIRETKIA